MLVFVLIIAAVILGILYYRHKEEVKIQKRMTYEMNIYDIDRYFNEEMNKA